MAQLLIAAGSWLAAAALLWRTAVPEGLDLPHVDADAVFGARAVEESADYRRFLRTVWAGLAASQLAALAALAWRAPALERRLRGPALVRGIQLGLASVVLLWVVWLPFGIAALWWRRRHDISHLGYGDLLLEPWPRYLGQVLVTAGAVAVAMALARRFGRRWWLLGGPAFVAIGAAVVVLTPLVLSPRHEPLREASLNAQIERLARDQGIEDVTVEVENASRRTTVPNAQAIGIGATTKVVLWDTLLDDRFTDREIEAIAAHELAHVSRDHLWKGLGWFALFALPGVYLLAAATERRGGLARPAVVPLGVLVVVAVQLALLPAVNVVSRRYEAEADWVALESTRDPEALRSLFRKFATTALDQPDPPAWVYVALSTHPSLAERVAMTEAWRISRSGEEPRAGS
jgi:STE24 endopeptidase